MNNNKGICQVKIFSGKDNVMEKKVNDWIEDFNKCHPGYECEIREIQFVPNGTRNESDVMIVYNKNIC